jgi:hypothetical protein
MRKKVLWIEDGAFGEVSILAAPVHLSGEYQLEYAFSATEAMQQLRRQEFDAVIVDIRIPPGDDAMWQKAYRTAGANNRAARLGLQLLETVLGGAAAFTENLPAATRDRHRYGVLSVESWKSLEQELNRLGVTRHRDKGSGDDPRVLLDLIDDIVGAHDVQ